jgi:hypothetical protein
VFAESIGLESIAAMKREYETTDLRQRLARYHGANVDVAFRGWNAVWLHPEFRDWNIEEFLPAIEVPIRWSRAPTTNTAQSDRSKRSRRRFEVPSKRYSCRIATTRPIATSPTRRLQPSPPS